MVELIVENLHAQGCYCARSNSSAIGYIDKKSWHEDEDRLGKGLTYVKKTRKKALLSKCISFGSFNNDY
ncbi:hypothetical protein ACX93W_09775 [Paenibacillus sp. CAU 1782]